MSRQSLIDLLQKLLGKHELRTDAPAQGFIQIYLMAQKRLVAMATLVALPLLALHITPAFAEDDPAAPAMGSKPAPSTIATETPSSPDSNEIRARALQMTGRPSRIFNLDGQVEIVRGASVFNSDTAEYHAVEDLVMAHGDLTMRRNQDCYTGNTLEMQLDTGAGYMTNPTYRLQKNNALGYAKRIDFIDHDQSVIEQGVYTTCEGTKPDWYLRSSRLSLDSVHDEGTAVDAVVYFKDVPILAVPAMSFPTSETRRSGFLPPEFSSSTIGGAELMVPYYLDIAPNRDATLSTRYISKRGIQLGGEFRYLDPTYDGVVDAEVNPQDQLTTTTRYLFGYRHNQVLAPGLSMNWDYNRASDDQYAVDYSHSITDSSQHLLPQIFNLSYGQPWGAIGLSTSNYQVLQDANNSIGKPYAIMPRLYSQSSGSDEFGGFDWSLGTEYTNFRSSTLVNGERLALNPQISYPLTGTYYFVTPKLLYHLSSYRLDRSLNPDAPTNPTLSVPTFSLDSGLYFERDTSFFDRQVTQTLEPRLFYVKTPFRDQTNIPLFDTGVSDINFYQIFTENRFSGQDRVGDANQITAGLISRFIEMDGQERLRLAIAQRYSFSQPLVVAAPTFSSKQINGDQVNYVTHSTIPSRSDFIFAANGKLTDTLSTEAVWRYSESQQSTAQLSYGLRWQPAPMKVINAQYRYQQVSEVNPETMRQVDVSGQWPLAARWYGVARSNYSIVDQRILDGLVGFEYKQDCWIARVVVQRYLVPSTFAQITSSSTTSIFLQLELSGLSKLGTNPLQTLKRSIPGYRPVTQMQY